MHALVEHLQDSETWPSQTMRASQLKQLRRLVEHAATECPYYRETGDWPRGRFGWQDWQGMPMLRRRTVQACSEALKAEHLPPGQGSVLSQYTTGSTGRPLRLFGTDRCHFVYGALQLREHRWWRREAAGRLAVARTYPGEGRFDNWGAPVAEVFDTGPLLVINVRRDVDEQLRLLREFAPNYLLTFATNSHTLARRAIETGCEIPSLREVRAYGELCRPDLADLCQQAFDARLSDNYSAEETGSIASRCPEKGNFHVHAESVLLEILDEHGQPCPPGRLGRVVVTPLHNFAMPLLRYDLGDYAAFGEACDCGRTLPVLARVAGRRRNMLVLPDGTTHWPSFPGPVWLPFPAITRIQLAQIAIDHVEVRVEASRDLSDDERARLFELLAERLHWSLRFTLRRMPRIGRDSDYKFEDFVSLVDTAP